MNTGSVLDKKLLAYALAGGAAIAAPAHAGSIFYYSGPTLSTEASDLRIDLNLDGDSTVDFSLLGAHGSVNNTILNQIDSINNSYTAAPLALGAHVAGSPMITGLNTLNQGKLKEDPLPNIAKQSGPFPVGSDSYIGLSFAMSGETHYGWALLNPNVFSIGETGSSTGIAEIQLKGYAYQTVAGRDILAGQTSETPEPSTLGLFALGAAGIA